jgi:RNA polymerase II C-terminal domain phosphatase-like 3/4
MQVLAGVRILFSRVIPIGHPQHEHELWKRAELFGATCFTEAEPSVTHVVTKALGTQKVLHAACAAPVKSNRIIHRY